MVIIEEWDFSSEKLKDRINQNSKIQVHESGLYVSVLPFHNGCKMPYTKPCLQESLTKSLNERGNFNTFTLLCKIQMFL